MRRGGGVSETRSMTTTRFSGLIRISLVLLTLAATQAAAGAVESTAPYTVRVSSAEIIPTGEKIYVSPTGADGAAGTLASPYRTIAKALSAAGAGDAVYLRGGSYPDLVSAYATGTSSAPVYLTAYPGEKPVITGRLKIYASNFRVSNLVFQGSAYNTETALIWIKDGSNVEISNNEIRNSDGSGVFGGGNGIRILSNWIHDNGTHVTNGVPQDHGIYWTGGTNSLIADNVIERSIGFGIQMHPYSPNIGNTIRNNTILNNGRLEQSSQGASGIVIDGSSSSSNVVTRNVLAWNSETGVRSLGTIGSGNVVRDNVGYQNPKGDFPTGYYGSGLLYDANLVAQPFTEATAGYGSSLAVGDSASGGGSTPPPPPDGSVDKALNRKATASSNDATSRVAANAVDGSSKTRWSSNYTNGQWWQVDLGRARLVDTVKLNWENAYASRYQILVSTDGFRFTLAADETLSAAGWSTATFSARSVRYVRVLGLTRATRWGISFWDAQVFGPAD